MVSQQHASNVLTSSEPAIFVHSRAAIVLQGKSSHQCNWRTNITMQCRTAPGVLASHLTSELAAELPTRNSCRPNRCAHRTLHLPHHHT